MRIYDSCESCDSQFCESYDFANHMIRIILVLRNMRITCESDANHMRITPIFFEKIQSKSPFCHEYFPDVFSQKRTGAREKCQQS